MDLFFTEQERRCLLGVWIRPPPTPPPETEDISKIFEIIIKHKNERRDIPLLYKNILTRHKWSKEKNEPLPSAIGRALHSLAEGVMIDNDEDLNELMRWISPSNLINLIQSFSSMPLPSIAVSFVEEGVNHFNSESICPDPLIESYFNLFFKYYTYFENINLDDLITSLSSYLENNKHGQLPGRFH